MAWRVRVVAVLLLTLANGSALASAEGAQDGNIFPSTLSETMFLKPNATTMNIIILADDGYGNKGISVTLQKKKCFPPDYNRYFTKVNVSKVSYGKFSFNFSVGVCEMNCTRTAGGSAGKLTKIIVIPLGLEKYSKTHETQEDHTNYDNISDCLQKETQETTHCICAFSTSATPTTHTASQSLPRRKLVIILLVAEVVQVLGTCVMTVIVIVVIRRRSRRVATVIRLGMDHELSEDISDAHSPNSTEKKDKHRQNLSPSDGWRSSYQF